MATCICVTRIFFDQKSDNLFSFFSHHPLLHGHILPPTTFLSHLRGCTSPNSAPFLPHSNKKMPRKQEIRSMERVSAQCCCIRYIVIEIFDCNCNDLELGRFKVIQGQRSWCQSIAHRWFPIRLPLTLSSYLSPFSKYLTVTV